VLPGGPIQPVHDERVRPYRGLPIFAAATIVQHYLAPEEMAPFHQQVRRMAVARVACGKRLCAESALEKRGECGRGGCLMWLRPSPRALTSLLCVVCCSCERVLVLQVLQALSSSSTQQQQEEGHKQPTSSTQQQPDGQGCAGGSSGSSGSSGSKGQQPAASAAADLYKQLVSLGLLRR
jgi:hypothetical protein